MPDFTDEELARLAEQARGPCKDELGLLVTGPDDVQLWEFSLDAAIEQFDQRGNTQRCRLWLFEEGPLAATPVARLRRAIQAAKARDVTLQLLLTHGADESTTERHNLAGGAHVAISNMRETYPVLFLASHGLRFGKESAHANR